ncbi:unnamed protein product [Closterium sp. NIES-65]|nr:unnamed protein product [Closterium sp. NIES-65]
MPERNRAPVPPTCATHLCHPPVPPTCAAHLCHPPVPPTCATHLCRPPVSPTCATHLCHPPAVIRRGEALAALGRVREALEVYERLADTDAEFRRSKQFLRKVKELEKRMERAA